MSPAVSLQQASLFVAQGFCHDAFASCPLLSVKCMFNGSALYQADRAWFAVDDAGYLILNDQQPYEIHIDSPTRVESFIIFFPRGWAEEVRHSLSSSTERLLDTPQGDAGNRVHFFERFTPHDQGVTPLVRHLRQAHRTGRLPAVWLEQVLREFKNTFHATPHEYLSACRVERVKFLLERTELSVTEICLAVGFESLGSF